MNNDHEISRMTRRAALLILSGADIGNTDADEALAFDKATLVEEFGPRLAQHWGDVESRVVGVRERFDEVTDEVQKVSPRWKVERMAPVDRSILRLGAWEILYGEGSPLEVIDHCVDLAKDYGEKETPAFVNGLLDQLCRDHQIEIV